MPGTGRADSWDERTKMAISGDVISDGLRIAAKRDISRVLGGAAQRARAAGPEVLAAKARAPFQLVETDWTTTMRMVDRLRGTAVWVDEGNCFNRAMLGAHMLDDMRGFGMGPADDAFAGAIAVSRHYDGTGGYVGGFHAGLAVKLPGLDEPQVIDLLPREPAIQPLSTWSRDPDPMLLRPYAGTGLWDGVGYRSEWVGDQFFDGAAGMLNQTWDNAETWGLQVRPLGHVPDALRG